MASISDVLLYVSSTSDASIQLMQYLNQNPIKLTLVRLDTAEDRAKAKTGGLFKITQVPTMVILRTDGRLQMFIGAPNIVSWIDDALGKSKPPPQQYPQQYPQQGYPHQYPPQHPQQGYPQMPQQGYPPHQSGHSYPSQEDDDPEEDYAPPKKITHKKPPAKKPSKKVSFAEVAPKKVQRKKRPPPKKRRDEDDDLVFEEEEPEEPPRRRQPSGLSTSGGTNVDRKKASISSVMEMAKEMEAQRVSSLKQSESMYTR